MSGEHRAPIAVAVADDSPSALELLRHVLEADPGLRVSDVARDGREIVGIVKRERPDVVVMDVLMPRMDGLAATREIMRTHPCPIVLVSGLMDPKESQTIFRAMEAGALVILAKPNGPNHPDHEASAAELRRMVRLMSQVNVVRRTSSAAGAVFPTAPGAVFPTAPGAVFPTAPGAVFPTAPGAVCTTPPRNWEAALVAIGASTGGPQALQAILSALGKDFPLPVLIAQHMTAGFCAGFADWLLQASGFPITIASSAVRPLPGRAYIAPDGHHLEVDAAGLLLIRPFSGEAAETGPSVGRLFRSVARSYGPRSIGVLLTGMGTDGAEDLAGLRAAGAATMAQDEGSSVVYGMPGQAVRLGAAAYVLPPSGIAELLWSLAGRKGAAR